MTKWIHVRYRWLWAMGSFTICFVIGLYPILAKPFVILFALSWVLFMGTVIAVASEPHAHRDIGKFITGKLLGLIFFWSLPIMIISIGYALYPDTTFQVILEALGRGDIEGTRAGLFWMGVLVFAVIAYRHE